MPKLKESKPKFTIIRGPELNAILSDALDQFEEIASARFSKEKLVRAEHYDQVKIDKALSSVQAWLKCGPLSNSASRSLDALNKLIDEAK